VNPPSAPPVLLLDGDAGYPLEIAAAGKSFGCKSFSQGPARPAPAWRQGCMRS
jgi:hypothetical protein